MNILAIDLGKQKSIGILYNTETCEDMQRTIHTTPPCPDCPWCRA